MNKFLHICIFVLICLHSYAQKEIVYLKFFHSSRNNEIIKDSIKAICNRPNMCMLYNDGKCYSEKKSIMEFITRKDFLTNTSETMDDGEIEKFCDVISGLLQESVYENSNLLKIKGRYDDQYLLTFVMSKNDNFDIICKAMNTTQLLDRSVKLRFLIYDDDGISQMDYWKMVEQKRNNDKIDYMLNF